MSLIYGPELKQIVTNHCYYLELSPSSLFYSRKTLIPWIDPRKTRHTYFFNKENSAKHESKMSSYAAELKQIIKNHFFVLSNYLEKVTQVSNARPCGWKTEILPLRQLCCCHKQYQKQIFDTFNALSVQKLFFNLDQFWC